MKTASLYELEICCCKKLNGSNLLQQKKRNEQKEFTINLKN